MKLSKILNKAPGAGLLVVLCVVLATPAWGEELVDPLSLLWRVDPSRLPAGSRDDVEEIRDVFTLEDAVALSLEANRLVKNPARLRSIRISVKHAYDGLQRVQRALELDQGGVRLYRQLERIATEAGPGSERRADLHRVRVSLAQAEHRVLDTQQELASWTAQLNFLMGRDRQVRLRAVPSPPDPALAMRTSPTGP